MMLHEAMCAASQQKGSTIQPAWLRCWRRPCSQRELPGGPGESQWWFWGAQKTLFQKMSELAVKSCGSCFVWWTGLMVRDLKQADTWHVSSEVWDSWSAHHVSSWRENPSQILLFCGVFTSWRACCHLSPGWRASAWFLLLLQRETGITEMGKCEKIKWWLRVSSSWI